MSRYKFKQKETQLRHAEILISLGEKLFYAGYITPIVILIKYGITMNSMVFASITFTGLIVLGEYTLHNGLSKHDKIKL